MTDGSVMTYRTGRVAAGETDSIWHPRSPRKGGCGLILCHGSDNPQGFIDAVNQPASVKMINQLAASGIPCIAGDFGFQAWGNDTVVSRINAAWNVLLAQYPNMRTDKMLLLGTSMGGAAVAHYIQENPTKVAGAVGLIPLWDLKSFYNYGPYAGAIQNQIASAWGVTAPAALPARADILANAYLGKNVPHLLGYSSVDATVLPAWSTNYANIVGAQTLPINQSNGHSDATIASFDVSLIGKFLVQNGA